MVKLPLEDLGSKIRLSCPVERIVVESQRMRGVRVAGGEEIAADPWSATPTMSARHRPHN